MSLQVWLPLNGNLNNQGLSDITSTGGTVNDTGILGKCYACSSSSYITIQNPVTDKYDFSFSFWMKIPTALSSVGSWNVMFLFRALNINDSSTENNVVINWADYNSIKIYDDANHQDIWMYPGNQFNYDKWCHYTITHTGNDSSTTIKVYTDGILRGTFNNSHRLVLRSGNILLGSGINPSYGPIYFNDFRLYDHCLSAKEVKEISKGLLCHYKLDNNGFGNPNLITTMFPGGRTTLNGKYGLNADFSQNTDTYGYFNVSPALELDSTYTLSFDVSNFPKGGSWNFMLWNNANYEVGTITKDGHYTYTFVPSTSKLPSGYNLTKFLFDDWRRTNPSGVVHFTNFKIEKGNKATPWCPHASDSMYTSLGLDSTTEVDCSGLSNNGTKIGGLTPSTSPISIRYESCYDFDGNTSSIQIPNLATLVPSGEFTMNCWIYHDDTWSSKTWETIFGGPSGFELEAKAYDTNSPALYAYSWGKGTATYELNKWNMITMTRNTSETKFYINGELKITGSAGTIPSGNYFIGAWNTSSHQNYRGRISDFRLYSTVLSVEDIRMLYDTSASVDKNGNMYAYEFKEE